MTTTAAPRRLIDYLGLARDFLDKKGIDDARLDAELLLAKTLGLTRLDLYTNHDRPLSDPEVDGYRALLKRRASREPVAYIVGEREFWSLSFAVDRRVLIPRPETELLVEVAIRLLKQVPDDRGSAETLRVADIGTGSGAIAVALASEVEQLRVVATDRSQAVLELAPLNAIRHGVSERVDFVAGDLCEPLAGRAPFDLIVSNPPYVSKSELSEAQPEVRDWEPSGALVAAEGGVETTRRLAEQAPAFLRADGWLVVEVGTQAPAVAAMLEANRWRDLKVERDLAGHDRVILARPPADG